MTQVILVDPIDQQIGVEEKLLAHQKGLLHRAFSVFIFNSNGKILLQKRAETKYHSAGLWTNACCSHPLPNEYTLDAAHRRLQEELGLKTQLRHLFHFTYKSSFENGLVEHELDHVFVGYSDELPNLNFEEASEYQFLSKEKLIRLVEQYPEKFTVWFKLIIEQVFESI